MENEVGAGHLDPTAELSLETVKQRTVKGVLALTGRTLILQIIALAAQGFLWAYLTPEEFGVFWIVSAIVNFLVYFSDIGLAAALIQKHKTPSEDDLKTTFTVQQILVLTLVTALFVISPILRQTHDLSTEGLYLMYALGISFFISSLKSIPSVLLERRLEFGKFIVPQILENVVYNVAVVAFAYHGFGIMSFAYSVLIRGVVGLIAIYALMPWKPGYSFNKESLKDLLKFGVPYQVNTLIAVFKDDGMTIILGSLLGPAGIGILGTAQKLAQYPLRFFLDNVTKVTFPAFSRMQDEKVALERGVTRSIFFITFLVFPSIIGLVLLTPAIMEAIPRYSKWEPALFPLALLSVNTIFAAVTTQLTNMFNAIGKIKTTFKLMVMWSVLTFLFVPVLSYMYGVNGAAVGYALVGLSSIVAIIIAKRMVNFSLMQSVLKPFAAALMMGIVVYGLRRTFTASLWSLLLIVLTSGVFYLTTSYFLFGAHLIADVKKGARAIIGRS